MRTLSLGDLSDFRGALAAEWEHPSGVDRGVVFYTDSTATGAGSGLKWGSRRRPMRLSRAYRVSHFPPTFHTRSARLAVSDAARRHGRLLGSDNGGK
jgi:hypothetical protein